jgi:type IV pilus assembly protein PilQ
LNTNLPEYRNRALITTRFQSAVDRITPTHQPKTKDTVIVIELREAVPYLVKQTDNIIKVDFSASSIPPKPYEDAKLPAWKKVLAEPATGYSATSENLMVSSEARAEHKLATGELMPSKEEMSLQERLAGAAPAQRYNGEKIALDFYDTDIKNVFRIIREISGKNFAIDKNVTGKVTLTLDKPVPWDQVLDLVLKMNQLGMTMEGDIVRIATLNTLAQEEKLRQAKFKSDQAALNQQKALEPLVTAYIPINYSDAKTEILPHIQPILSATRGKASVDVRNNQIIITDTAVKIQQAREIVQIIDKVTPQVIIEARIVEANTAFTRDLGFDWGTISAGPFNIGDATLTLTGLASNLPATIPSAVVGGTFQKLSGTPFSIVDAKLVASETEGKTNIISAPKVVTLDNKKAKIKQGLEVPYLERDSSGNATVRFKNVDLLLEVTPNITPDDRIVMKIFVTKNDVVDPTADQPALSTNEAQTELLVDNGDTIVIGGIVKSTIQYGEKGIPGLRQLGVLGWLFKAQSKKDQKNELLIFITPRIVKLKQKKMNI